MPETSNVTLQLVGNYELLEKIAEGGMGAIYKGRNRDTGQVVAVKVMAPNIANNPILLKRFEQEFRAASRLDHPHVVRALDYGEHGNTPYLVMEFVEGESLGAKLERDGKLPEQEAIRLITQVSQGLHRAHKHNLVHRDVKPDNILLTHDGQAKLADLGLVKETETDLNLTKTGRGLGTPHFMAPEQFRNAKNADVRCDIYSLGATLYMMVTGELPFRSSGPLDAWMKKIQNDLTPPKKLVPTLSDRVDWAIQRAMSADPERRPVSCREFVEDLIGHSTKKVPSTDSSTPLQELWYLVYRDEIGTTHTVKGSTSAIRRSLKDGLLGDASNVRASRSKQGPFDQLKNHAEFRDMLVQAAPLPVRSGGAGAVTAAGLAPASGTGAAGAAYPARSPTAALNGAEVPTATYAGPIPVTPLPKPQAAPHFALHAGDEPPSSAPSALVEVLKWSVLFAVAVLTALLAFYLIPIGR